VSIDLDDFRIITASAYAGMMAPLTDLPSSVCVLTGDTDNGLGCAGVATQSLEELDGVRRRWRLGDVARLADFVPKILSRSPADRRPALLVPPRLTTAWEQAAQGWPDGIVLLGRPAAQVSRLADDKVFVREQLRRIGVTVPDAEVVVAGELIAAFPRLSTSLGLPFVAQTPQGAGGQGTYLVRTRSDLAHAVHGHPHASPWLVSAFAGELTVNVTGLVDGAGTHILAGSVQSSGIGELGSGFGAYCGSDFGRFATVPSGVVDAAYAQTRRVGDWLGSVGHRGLFGADIAVAGREIAFLEVNPRIQGSSWLLSKLERRHGGEGCLVRHVAALADPDASTGDDHPVPPGSFDGSHLIVRWTAPGSVVRSVPLAGTYRLGDGGETVTVTGLPAVGSIIMTGAIAARFEAGTSLTEPGGTALRPAVREFLARWWDGWRAAGT